MLQGAQYLYSRTAEQVREWMQALPNLPVEVEN